MKRFVKIVSAALAAALAVSVAACDQGSAPENKKKPYTLAENGQTQYSVVIPAGASEIVQFAAEELQFFFKEGTGIELAVKTDSGITAADGKYISLGRTSLAESAKIAASENELGIDGYVIRQEGDDLYLCGGGDDGTVYAVYGLLAELMDLEIYAPDCWTMEKKDAVAFGETNITEIPDIPFRVIGRSKTWYGDNAGMFRMRVTNAEKRMSRLGHAFYAIIPTSYYADHKDWFTVENPSGQSDWQLCLSQEDMKAEFIKNVETYVADNPDIDIIALGQNDGGGYCDCDACKAKREQYGAVSGIYVEFCNDVAEAVTEWLRKTDAARADRLQFYMFAYNFTETAPVVNGVPTIRCADNMGILIAPIGAHVSHAYTDMATNAQSAAIFRDWQLVSDNFYIWSYSTHFANYYMPHNSFGSIQKNIQSYVDMGAKFVFDQATCGNSVSNFDMLKTYLFSKLMWDSTLDFDTLVRNFINAYYGETAGEYVYRFFDVMRSYLTVLESEYSQYAYCAGQLSTNVSSQYFPQNFVYYLDDIFYEAFEALEESKAEDEAAYTVYKDRLDFEYLDVLYLELQLYRDTMSNSERKNLIEQFQDIAIKNRMNNFNENGSMTLSSLVGTWEQ